MLDIEVDSRQRVPISRQIFLQLRQAIVERSLPDGSPLPSSRELGRRLGVSRTSVISAYDDLSAEGYLQGRHGSGTFVTFKAERLAGAAPAQAALPTPSSGRRLSAAGSSFVELSKRDLSISDRPFSIGRCSVDRRTSDAWRRICLARQPDMPGQALGYPDLFGEPRLREVVAEYLRVFRGVKCDTEAVMVTSGTQQALDLCIKVLLNPGDSVWIEDPCHPAMLRAFLAAGMNVVGVPVDAEGLCVEAGLKQQPRPRAIFVTPSHQYPTGAVMSLGRRHALLAAAGLADAWIFEDDYDSEFRYTGQPLTSLQGLDTHARVLYIGTLSKVLFPGLRTGFTVVPADLEHAFLGARYATDRGPPVFHQQIIADFMREGFFTSHVQRMRLHYRSMRDLAVSELRRHLGAHARIQVPAGGMRVLAYLRDGLDDREVARAALEREVVVRPLSPLFIQAPPVHGLEVGFTGFSAAQLTLAAARLGDAVKQVARAQRPAATPRQAGSGAVARRSS